MWVIAIDPGLANCGIARLEVLGPAPQQMHVRELAVLRTEPSPKKQHQLVGDDLTRRTRELAGMLDRWLASRHTTICDGPDLTWREVGLVCCEAWSCPRAAGAAARTALARGVLYGACQRFQLPLLQVTPREIRRALGLPGTANKYQVEAALEIQGAAAWLARIGKSTREHAADALAVAQACSQTSDTWRAMVRR